METPVIYCSEEVMRELMYQDELIEIWGGDVDVRGKSAKGKAVSVPAWPDGMQCYIKCE